MDVSIIIVNYNTKNLLRNCLESIFKYTQGISFEVIVSDNGSSDGSVEMLKAEFPQVILIENNANLGFGTANNRGLDIANGTYIFYLNSDTILLNNAVKIFFDYWENAPEQNSLGVIGCNLLDENMEFTHSYGKFPIAKKILRNTVFDFFRVNKLAVCFFFGDNFSVFHTVPIKNKQEKYVGGVDYIVGADLFLKNDSLAQFDEKFFLYYEDTDLQKQMETMHKTRIIIDGPIIQHLEHKSNKFKSKLDFYKSISKIHLSLSAVLFLKKYESGKFSIFAIQILLTLIWLNPFLVKTTFKYIPKLWK